MAKPNTPARSARLAAAVAAVAKTVVGANIVKPAMVEMPKTVHELHVSPTEFLPPDTLITPEIAELAGLDDDEIKGLIDKGAIAMVDVLSTTAAALTSDEA